MQFPYLHQVLNDTGAYATHAPKYDDQYRDPFDPIQ